MQTGGEWTVGRSWRELGFAVRQTDEALLRVWRRAQERAHAAYGNPPRPLPPRCVPVAERDGEG